MAGKRFFGHTYAEGRSPYATNSKPKKKVAGKRKKKKTYAKKRPAMAKKYA